MSALSILKSRGFKDSKPYRGFASLAIGNYPITKFRWVKNKNYNEKREGSLKRVLLVELEDQVLFLPEYFARGFDDDDKKVKELNTDGVKKFLHFGGKRSNT